MKLLPLESFRCRFGEVTECFFIYVWERECVRKTEREREYDCSRRGEKCVCKKQGVKVKSYIIQSQHRHKLAPPSTFVFHHSCHISLAFSFF